MLHKNEENTTSVVVQTCNSNLACLNDSLHDDIYNKIYFVLFCLYCNEHRNHLISVLVFCGHNFSTLISYEWKRKNMPQREGSLN